jgi:phage terminase large subunit GpA-like protein
MNSPKPAEAEVAYRSAIAVGIRPEPEMTVSEHAEQFRYLPKVSSAEPGKWRNSRTPYLKEIMDCLSPSSPIVDVWFMKPAQIGGTECGNNWVDFVIDKAPGPMMYVEPTVDLAKRVSKQRLQPMIDESPVLKGKVKDSRSRDSAKEFPGGVLILTGANSAAGLRSMPARYLFLDEVDAYPGDVEGEGDPIRLAAARTSTFARKKRFMVSTPVDRGSSRIEAGYEDSDKRRYFIPCPFCKAEQILRWSGIVFTKDEKYRLTGPVRYKCEHCGELIEERYKTWMLENGRWIAEAPAPGKAAGFHLSALYSPIGWKSWADCVEQFLEARKKRDKLLLKTWTNTVLGETWEEEGLTVDDGSLLSRREEYTAPVPLGVAVLTAGVDVQDDRLLVKVKGWGRGEESWLIDWITIPGRPETDPKVWVDLDAVLSRVWAHELGTTLRIAAACIDSGGHATKQAYDFARTRGHRRIFAIKGVGGAGAPVIKLSTRKNKGKVVLALVGADTCKGLIYSRLQVEEYGPGYMHFPRKPEIDEEYFKQLTAEKQITKFVRGFPSKVWMKTRARNEALDCEAYALAALATLNANLEQLAQRLEAQAEFVKKEKEPDPPPDNKPTFQRRTIAPRRGWSATKW